MSNVKIYTKDKCVQCDWTRKLFDQLGITYQTFNIEADAKAKSVATASGFLALPLVVTDNGTWSGFSPDKIKAYAQAVLQPACLPDS